MPPQDIHPQMPPAKSNAGTVAAVIIAIIIIAAIAAFAVMHSKPAATTQQAAQNGAATTPPLGSMSGSTAPATADASLTTYTGQGDTFFNFSYPTGLQLTQYPAGVSLTAATGSPLLAGRAADDNHEFDVYLSGDTEAQVRASVILATTTKIMDAPTDGYVTYDLVLPHIMYHVIDLYTDQGHELDLVVLGSYDTKTNLPQAWVNAYKTIAGSVSIDPKKLAQFIADAKARGAAAQAAASTTTTVSSH